MNKLKFSGLLYFFAGAIVLMGIITAEAFYPSGYSTFKNEISDLGAARQPNSISFEPSSTIFNTVMLLAGIMVLAASFFQYKYFRKFLFSIPAILFGLGLVGVGIFPGIKSSYHGMAAMLTFYRVDFVQLPLLKLLQSPLNISPFYLVLLFC